MASQDFKFIESLLDEYSRYPKYLKRRREELQYPVKPDNLKVGNNPNFNTEAPQESFVIKLSQDERLNQLEKQYEVMTEVLEGLASDEYQIIELYYLKKPRTLTWEGIANKVHCSRRRCFDVRNKVITEIGQRLGLMDY